jgi:diguanylate cyclase (GGDEF)-like protein
MNFIIGKSVTMTMNKITPPKAKKKKCASAPARPLKSMSREERLDSMFRITSLINSSLDLSVVLENVLKIATEVVAAEASSIVLIQPGAKEVVFETTVGAKAEKVKKFTLQLGEGIAGWVALTGQSVMAPDVKKDPRYTDRVAKSIRFKTRCILCVPIKIKNSVIGSLEVINKKSGAAECFDDADMKLLTAVASQAAIAIENARLYREAITDELTALYSFRYFQTYFNREINRAERAKRPLSLLMMDIDNFKKFNDAHGHALGNTVLRMTADIIRKRIRDTDVCARYGGEEFVIVLQEIEKKTAMTIAERLRAEVESMKIHGPSGGKLKITCSIGVATYPEDTLKKEDIFFRADHALYEAKLHGKNRVFTLEN